MRINRIDPPVQPRQVLVLYLQCSPGVRCQCFLHLSEGCDAVHLLALRPTVGPYMTPNTCLSELNM